MRLMSYDEFLLDAAYIATLLPESKVQGGNWRGWAYTDPSLTPVDSVWLSSSE